MMLHRWISRYWFTSDHDRPSNWGLAYWKWWARPIRWPSERRGDIHGFHLCAVVVFCYRFWSEASKKKMSTQGFWLVFQGMNWGVGWIWDIQNISRNRHVHASVLGPSNGFWSHSVCRQSTPSIELNGYVQPRFQLTNLGTWFETSQCHQPCCPWICHQQRQGFRML